MNFFWSQRLEMDLKWTRDHSYWNVTICSRDSHSNANKGHRFPKCTLAGHSIGQTFALWANVILFLQAFQQSIVTLWIMPWSTPIGLRHEVLAVAREGKRQCAIAHRVGITHVTINHILQRHATTGSLGPGSPQYSERTALKVHVLWLRGCATCMESGLAARLSTIDLWPVAIVLAGPWGRPHWLPIITECAWPVHRGGGIWPSPNGSTSSLATSPDSNFILLMARWGCVVCQGSASLRIARWIESRQVVGPSTCKITSCAPG